MSFWMAGHKDDFIKAIKKKIREHEEQIKLLEAWLARLETESEANEI